MTDTQDGDLSQGLDPAQYEALKKEFDDVILTMGADKNFAPYKLEYEKLYRSLKTSYESEKRLVKRCKEL